MHTYQQRPEQSASRFSAIATAVALTVALSSCSGESESNASCCDETAHESAQRSTPLPGTSLYHIESRWLDRTGQPRVLRDFEGKPCVLVMVFTRCAYACPRILSDLKGIESALTPKTKETVHFVLVSMDSKRDTPAVLAKWGADNDLPADRWTLLHGAATEVRELAATLGVQMKELPTGDFSHSNLITVLDRQGRITHRQTGLNAPSEATVAELEALSR